MPKDSCSIGQLPETHIQHTVTRIYRPCLYINIIIICLQHAEMYGLYRQETLVCLDKQPLNYHQQLAPSEVFVPIGALIPL